MSATPETVRRPGLKAFLDSTTEMMRFLMLGLMLAAISTAYVTFQNWVNFSSGTSLKGIDADSLTSSGDGYLVLGCVALILVATTVALVAPRMVAWAMPVVGIAAVAILFIATNVIFASWRSSGFTSTNSIYVEEGTVAAPAYLAAFLGGMMAIVAAIIAGLSFWETDIEEEVEG